jgi:hypothetical protein
MTKEKLIEARKAYSQVIRELETVEGKTDGQLSQTQAKHVQSTYEKTKDYVLLQNIRGRSKTGKPTIDLTGARAELAKIEEKIHRIDTLETCPALDEYREAIQKATEAHKRLIEESGMINPGWHANYHGLVHGQLTYS